VTVALVQSGVGAQTVEVPATFDIVDPYSLATCEDHIQWSIVVSPIVVLKFDEFLRCHQVRDHSVPPCVIDKRLSRLRYIAVE
jgi:hypothetical protein